MEKLFFINYFFYFFSTLSLASAVMVIIVSNPVYSILFLISVFFNASLILLLLDLEFLAVLFILIYIGAIMVLFLFVIMMLDIKSAVSYINLQYYFFISGLILSIVALEFLILYSCDLVVFTLSTFDSSFYTNWFNFISEVSNIKMFGYLYTYFSFFFMLAGLILLVAMIGAIVLTLTTTNRLKSQFLHKQISADPKKSIFYRK